MYNKNPAKEIKNSLKDQGKKALLFSIRQRRKHIFTQGIITAFPKSSN